MHNLISESRNVNIRHNLPEHIWEKVPEIYKSMEGWLGFGDGKCGEKGIPYWYGFDDGDTSISASVEPSGLQFCVSNIDEEKWNSWLSSFKSKATEKLGFKVSEIELGEVGQEIEWSK